MRYTSGFKDTEGKGMKRRTVLGLLMLAVLCFSVCRPAPPKPEPRPDIRVYSGVKVTDDYSWMKDRERENKDVLSVIAAENRYAGYILKRSAELKKTMKSEMISRLEREDVSVPYKIGRYLYYRRYAEDTDQPVFCRMDGTTKKEEILLDVNEIARGKKYCDVASVKCSTDGRFLGYLIDNTGSEAYTLIIKDLVSGKELEERLEPVSEFEWAESRDCVFYTLLETYDNSVKKAYMHMLLTEQKSDILLYEEKEPAFQVGIGKTKDNEYILIDTGSNNENEEYLLSASGADVFPKLVQKRQKGLKYGCAHNNGVLYILNNACGAYNFKISKADISRPGMEGWRDFIPHREDTAISFDIFKNHIAVLESKNFRNALRFIDLKTGKEILHTFDDPTLAIYFGNNPEFDTYYARFSQSSFTSPESVVDYDMRSNDHILLRKEKVAGYESSNYVSERIYAASSDGAEIPVSLVYRKGLEKNGKNPLLIYGYGAYGDSTTCDFDPSVLSLIDRGFIYAVAHVRGGGEMGKKWYDDGRLLKKKNTFDDFIACTEFLISEKYTSAGLIALKGESAGGLLAGAVLNRGTGYYYAAIMSVPFVDVLNTMFDTTLSGTLLEYDEWGDPNDKEIFRYIRSYCPYQNIRAAVYPNILVISGFNDQRVNYWEHLKYVSKLRAMKTDDNILILKTTDFGHFGDSGRFDYYDTVAEQYAFILDILETGQR